MELTLQSIKSGLFIKNYEKRTLFIDDKKYTDNLVVTNQSVEKWGFNNKDVLGMKDFEKIIDKKPEIIILGTGADFIIPEPNIINSIQKKGIGFEFMITESACKTFNLLVSENRKVAAVLVL